MLMLKTDFGFDSDMKQCLYKYTCVCLRVYILYELSYLQFFV